MQFHRLIATATLVVGLHIPLPIMAETATYGDAEGSYNNQESGTSADASVSALQIDLPGSGRLPSDDREAEVASVEFEGFGSSFGCDGLGLTSMVSRFESELEVIVDYYSENIGDLALQALIYTEPSLYTMLNTTIADFKASMDQMLAGCNQARLWGKKLGQEAKSYCLEDGGTAAICNDGEFLAESAAEQVKTEAAKLNRYVEETLANSSSLQSISDTSFGRDNHSDANGGANGGSTGGSGGSGSGQGRGPSRGACADDDVCGGSFNRLIVNGYIAMRKETIDMLRMTVPSLAPAAPEEAAENSETESEDSDESDESDSDDDTMDANITRVERRPAKLHKWLNNKQAQLATRLDTMVEKAGKGESYAAQSAAYEDEPYAVAPDGRTLRKLARLRQQVLKRLHDGTPPSYAQQSRLSTYEDTHYGKALAHITAEQARDAAKVAIAEFEAGLHNASIDRTTKSVLDESNIKHYETVIRTLRAELQMAEHYAESERRQRQTFKDITQSIGAVN